ncbi:MAG: hypothetical protein ABSD12_21050 [Paraburkholderia sp.]|jgi:hypothetical protein
MKLSFVQKLWLPLIRVRNMRYGEDGYFVILNEQLTTLMDPPSINASSDKIDNIVGIVEGIAFQSNILKRAAPPPVGLTGRGTTAGTVEIKPAQARRALSTRRLSTESAATGPLNPAAQPDWQTF